MPNFFSRHEKSSGPHFLLGGVNCLERRTHRQRSRNARGNRSPPKGAVDRKQHDLGLNAPRRNGEHACHGHFTRVRAVPDCVPGGGDARRDPRPWRLRPSPFRMGIAGPSTGAQADDRDWPGAQHGNAGLNRPILHRLGSLNAAFLKCRRKFSNATSGGSRPKYIQP